MTFAKNIEIHLPSLVYGVVIGSVITGATVLALGAMFGNQAPSRAILDKAVELCDDKNPLYIQQAGGLLNVKCNGHREDRPLK